MTLGGYGLMVTIDAGPRVSDYLLSASDDSFSSSLALIEELSLLGVTYSTGADVLGKVGNKFKRGTRSSNSGHFEKKVVAKSKTFAGLPRGERLLKTIGELQKLIGVAPRDLRTPLDFAEVADDLCMAGVNILRKEKKAHFTGHDAGAMIEFHMTKIFGGPKTRMDELSSAQQQSLVDRVRKFLQSLPADQQRFIMDKLGVEDLSEPVIRQAIASGTIWAAFAAAVNFFGFTFYTTAAQLLAILSFHLLPFGAYAGLSSTIAVLSSAWMLPILAGLGIWYYSWKNKGLRQSMAPLILTSLCLSGMEGARAHGEAAVDEAFSLWGAARGVRDQRRSITTNARLVHIQAQARRTASRNELAYARTRKQGATTERRNLEKELEKELLRDIKFVVDAIANGRWGASLIGAANKVQQIENEISSFRLRQDDRSGIWAKAGGFLKGRSGLADLDGELKAAKRALVQQVKSTWPKEGTAYPPNAASLLRAMEEKTSQIRSAEADINRVTIQEREDSKKVDQASRELPVAEAAQTESEKRYHGLREV